MPIGLFDLMDFTPSNLMFFTFSDTVLQLFPEPFHLDAQSLLLFHHEYRHHPHTEQILFSSLLSSSKPILISYSKKYFL